ncbi:tetratricopeptide repeat protein, partial [bacterium]|nr:tetratricopeptide repeat protein [bacterium]
MFKFVFQRIFSIGLLLLFVVLSAGCWGEKFFEMPQRTIDTSCAVDTLLTREKNLEERLDKLQKEFVRQQEYSRRTTASAKMDTEGVKDQLNVIQQLLLESSLIRSSEGIMTTPRQRGGFPEVQQLTGKGNKDTLKTILEGDSVSAGLDSISGSGSKTPLVPDSALVGVPDDVPSAEVIFRQIYLDFSRMEYQIALDDSKLFLKEYQGDPLVQEVIFIRGECLIEQDKYFDALKEFSKILKNYPKGKKVPAALLRMAIAYDKIGDSDLAAGMIRRLVRDYPYSEETAVAKEKFGEMLK